MHSRSFTPRLGRMSPVAHLPATKAVAAGLVAACAVGAITLKAVAGPRGLPIETAALVTTQDTVSQTTRDVGVGRAIAGKDDGRLPGTPLQLTEPPAPKFQAPAPAKAQQAPARHAAVHGAPRRSTSIIGIGH